MFNDSWPVSPQVHSYFYHFSFFFSLTLKPPPPLPHHCCWLCNRLILVGLATPPHTSLGHKRATSPTVCQQGGRAFITVVWLVCVCTFSGCVGFTSKGLISLLCAFWPLLIQCLSDASSWTRSTGLPAHAQKAVQCHMSGTSPIASSAPFHWTFNLFLAKGWSSCTEQIDIDT